MPEPVGEAVILSAAREFLTAAKSFASSDPSTQACQRCLMVWADRSPALEQHRSVLAALTALAELGGGGAGDSSSLIPTPSAWAQNLRVCAVNDDAAVARWDAARCDVAVAAVAELSDPVQQSGRLLEIVDMLLLPGTGPSSADAAKLALATALAARGGV